MKPESISGDSFVKALPPEGELVYVQDWLQRCAADRIFEALLNEVAWAHRNIRMFGKEMVQPRRIAFQGNPGIAYAYSGGRYEAAQWHREVAALRETLDHETGDVFNCALLNLYRDGKDSMGWHSDDEPELGRNPVIASVSLGAGRRFVLRSKSDRHDKIELVPEHGSLILMRGDVQANWQHQVPKTARAVDPRINLTFRRIVHPTPTAAARRP